MYASHRLYALALLPAIVLAGQAVAQEVTLDSVDQRIRVLERKIEIDKEDAATAAKSTAAPTAAAQGFSLASTDQAYTLQFKFLGQLDYRQFFNDDRNVVGTAPSGSTAIDTFSLRRVRPILAGTLGKNVEFNFTPDFSGGDSASSTAGLVDAWASYKVNNYFGIKAGKYTLGVVLEPGANRHFNESPFTNSLAPARDLGVEIYGSPNAFVDYRVGVFNGARDDTSGVNSDTGNDKILSGRLTLKPLAGIDGFLKPLALSVGFSNGDESAPPGNTSTITNVATVSRRQFFGYGNNQVDGKRTRLSPALALYSGPFSLVGEYITEKADYLRTAGTPVAAVARFNAKSDAWRSSIGWVLTGESSSGNVNPKKPFAVGAEGWGAFELAAFVSKINFGNELFSNAPAPNGAINPASNARQATEYGLAGNWYLTRNYSLRLNLEQSRFDSAYLRDDPTDAAPARPADKETAASLRFQIQF